MCRIRRAAGEERNFCPLPETEADKAVELAENLRNRVGAHTFAADLHCTVSIGVAEMRTVIRQIPLFIGQILRCTVLRKLARTGLFWKMCNFQLSHGK